MPTSIDGDVAQSGERLLCKQEGGGSSPLISTTNMTSQVLYLDNYTEGKKASRRGI